MYLQDREVLAARTLTLPGPGGQADATSSSSTFSAKSTPIVTPTSLLPHSFVAQTSVSTSDSTPTEGAVSKSASSGKSSNKGPIIGGVIGGVVFLAICAGLLWFCLRRRRKQKEMDEMARGLTPMLGSPANGTEKFAMDNSPDLGEDGERQSGGVFAPFGGYQRTPSVEIQEERGPSIDIGERIREDEPLPDPEKTSLVAPPVEQHPAMHPLPGVSSETPTYYPGGSQHPAYNTLPSQRGRHPTHVTLPDQRGIAEASPEIPDFEFSPVELLPEDQFDHLDAVPLTPHTPQAELAAFPSPPNTIASQLSNLAKLRRNSTPPRNARPHRRSTPPRMSLPLTRLMPPTSDPNSRPTPRHSSQTSLQLFTLSRKPTPLPFRPRTLTYPSPTAGGRPELPASLPIAKTPKNPIPAFHHISLPSPQEPLSASSIRRNESTATSYSIPIGLGSPDASESWPLHAHPVTSDAHHLREQPSSVSALSVMRDLQNASAVSALTTTSEEPAAESEGHYTPLKHNHSNEYMAQDSQNEHVMSWQDYVSPGTGKDEVSPMFSPPITAGGYSAVSPMFSPPLPSTQTTPSFLYTDPLPSTVQHGYAPLLGNEKRVKGKGKGKEKGDLNIKVGLTPLIGGKKFSLRSLEQRERERRDYFADLSIQPLNPDRRTNTAGSGMKGGVPNRKPTRKDTF